MNPEKGYESQGNRRRFQRLPFQADVELQLGPGSAVNGRIRDLSQGGLSMHSCKALQRGQRALLRFTGNHMAAASSECLGEVVWSREADDGFVSGLHIFHDEPAVVETLSAVVYGVLGAGGMLDLRESGQPQPAMAIQIGLHEYIKPTQMYVR